MGISAKEILDRVNKLLQLTYTTDEQFQVANTVFPGTLTVMEMLYGSKSHQINNLINRWKTFMDDKNTAEMYGAPSAVVMLRGILQNIKAEVESGFVGDLHLAITGDILTDLIKLARKVLEEKGEGPKNVAAALSAAAYEDTIRRLAKNKGLSKDGKKLADLIIALKDADILKGAQVGIAQSYLNFRN